MAAREMSGLSLCAPMVDLDHARYERQTHSLEGGPDEPLSRSQPV
jgi:hypothetical protein